MSDYTQITDFSAKDVLSTGDPEKLILGSDIDDELGAIATAIGTKYDSSDIASQAEAEAETSNAKVITPLRLANWADANGGIVGDLQAASPTVDSALMYDASASAGKAIHRQLVMKTAAETVSNSTTLQDDDHIVSITLKANTRYRVKFVGFWEAKAASDLKYIWVLSQTPVSDGDSIEYDSDGTGSITANASFSGTQRTHLISSNQNLWIMEEGWFHTNASTGGTLKLQWAQQTAVAENTTLKEGSYLILEEVT